MVNDELKEILANSFRISTEKMYNVRIHQTNDDFNKPNYTDKKINYLELGLLLNTQCDNIGLVEVHMKL